MADPINDTAAPSVEQTYAQVRDAVALAAGPDGELVTVAPQLRRLELRTPTLPPATHTGCYVLGATEGAGPLLLVDPGSPYPDQQRRLDDLLEEEAGAGRYVTGVLLTHHHGDHVGGAAHLQARWNIPILAHEITATLLASRVTIDKIVHAGPLNVGDLALEVHHTPGHAAGHLCLAVPSAAATIVGDMVAGIGTILIDPDEGDMSEYLESLQRLEAISPGLLLPAHGPVIPDGVAKLRAYRAHRLLREQKIAEALDAHPGARAEDLVPLAYADTPRPFWPLAVRSTLAHLGKLMREGRATWDGAQRWTGRTA